MSTLSAYYSTGSSLSTGAHKSKLLNEGLLSGRGDDPAVIAPWQFTEPELSDAERLNFIFNSKPLIDLEHPLASIDGDNSEFNNLFALHRGLSRMRELVTFGETGRADSLRTILNQRFGSFLTEVNDFTKTLSFSDMSLIPGISDSKMDASFQTPRALSETDPEHYGAQVSTVQADAIAGITGTELFTITSTTSSGTTNVALDLSAVAGTLNLDNIVDYINGELSANGVITTLSVERFDEFSYGIKLNLNASESISFTADPGNQQAAVYVAGSFGTGDLGNGFLMKFDDLASASPTNEFRSDVSSDVHDDARATAVDSLGNVYVVGTTSGDLSGELNQGTPDAYLRKYDAAGELIYSRLLGSTSNANGYAVTVDSSDNVIIAGETIDTLTDDAYGGGFDSFITKFDSDGVELWTRQAGPFATDGAFALTTDASDNIFIAGQAASAVSDSVTHAGGLDAYLTKVDSAGTLVWNKQFGTTSDDRATAITVDNAGSVFVAAESGGNAVLRKYTDEATSQTPVWEVDLGAVNSDGGVTGVALGDGGNVYISGYTSNAGLSGTITQAHSGGIDGFVSRIDDAGASATINNTTYVGSADEDRINGITVKADAAGDEIYLTGNTTGSIGGATKAGETDGFVSRLDNAGNSVWTSQFGGGFTHSGQSIVYDATGTSVVSRLGLPAGPVPAEPPTDLGALTSVRPGQSFKIAVNGGIPETVTIEEGDTYGLLAAKINKILGTDGAARNDKEIGGRLFSIEALRDARIDIIAGPEGSDALAGLGLREGTLFAEQDDATSEASSKNVHFSLGLFDDLNVLDRSAAADAGIIIDSAMLEVRKAFDFLNGTTDEDPLSKVRISAANQARINSLQFALERVSSFSVANATLFDLKV